MGLGTKAYLVGALLTFYSSVAAALGLGEITLNSALNQPLDAQIELLHVRDLSEREIRVGLASSEDFARAGVDRSYFLTNLEFEVDLNAPDGPLVRVTSDEPVREPFINFLVSARWPSGRLLREYTLLVDLPVFSGEEAAPVQAAPRQQSDTGRRTSPSSTEAAGTPSTRPTASGEEYGPVGANENLWSIASRVRPDNSVTVQQTMLALQRLNPDAFINNNINLLRRGQVLRVPSKSDIQSLSPQQAVSEVASQNRRWNQRQAPEGEPSAQLEGSRTPTATRTESSAPEGRVSLSSSATSAAQGEGTGAGEGEAGQIRNRLAVTQEELDAASRENADLKSRLSSVEEQIETLEKLVEVSSEELRSLELAAQQTNDAAGDEVVGPADEPAEDAAAEAAADSDQEQQPTTAQPQAVAAQSSWLDRVMDNILYIVIGLGAIAVAIGLWLYMRNRDDGFDDEFDEDLEADFEHEYQPAVTPGPIDEDPALAAVPYGAESDEDAPAETEMVNEAETEDVVGESDIHIAYGQYEQAEEKLARALEREPNNVAMRMKLLEVFAAQDDVANFDQHYAKLHKLEDQAAIDRAATLRAGISGAEPFDLAANDSASQSSTANDSYESTDTQVPFFDSEASGDAADIADDTLQFDLNAEEDAEKPLDEDFSRDSEGLTLDLDDDIAQQEEDATVVQDRFATEPDTDLSLDLDDEDSFAPGADDTVIPAAVAAEQDRDQELEQELDGSLDAIEDSLAAVGRQGEAVEPDVAVRNPERDDQSGVLDDLEFDLDEINADLSFDDVELDLEFASFDSFTEEQEDDTRIAETAKNFDLPEDDSVDLAVHADLGDDAEFRFDEELAPVHESASREDSGAVNETEAVADEGAPVERALEPTPAGSAAEEAIPEDFDLEFEGDLEPADLTGEAPDADRIGAGEADAELAGLPADFDDLELGDLGELDIDDEQIDGGEAATFDASDDNRLELANNLAGEPLTGDPEEDDAEAIAQQLADAGPIDSGAAETKADDDFELEGDVDLDDLDRDLDSLTSDFDDGFASTDALMDEPVTEFDEFDFDELDLDEDAGSINQESSSAASAELAESPTRNEEPLARDEEPSAEFEEPTTQAEESPTQSEEPSAKQEPSADETLSTDLDQEPLTEDDQSVTADEVTEQVSIDGYDSSADFEIPDFDPESDDDSNLDFLSDNDETATKLDLARAYIDMGDADGAKDILDEILDEGNDQQKQEAETLLARLA